MSKADIKRALIAERGSVVRAAARLLRDEVKASPPITQTTDGKYKFRVEVYRKYDTGFSFVSNEFIILPTKSPKGNEISAAIEELLMRKKWLDADKFEYFKWDINFREETWPYRQISQSSDFGPDFPKNFIDFTACITNIFDAETVPRKPPARGD